MSDANAELGWQRTLTPGPSPARRARGAGPCRPGLSPAYGGEVAKPE